MLYTLILLLPFSLTNGTVVGKRKLSMTSKKIASLEEINKKKKSPFRWLKHLLLILLILVGLVLLFNKSIRNTIIAWNSNKYQIINVSQETINNNKKKKASYDFDSVSSLALSTILSEQMNSQDLAVVGGIAIPDLNINLPIFKGVGDAELSYGAGTMKENQEMGQGNYALASHHVFGITGSSAMLFSPLVNAKEGMTIYLTDKTKVYIYKITSVETVDPTDVQVIDDVAGETLVTLVTCNDAEATQRIIVKGTYQNSVSYDKASTTIKKAFKQSYNQIQK